MKAVFFDAGGTLVHIDWVRVAALVQTAVGREISPTVLAEAEYAGRDAIEEAMARGEAGADATLWKVSFGGILRVLGLDDGALARITPLIVAEQRRTNLWSRTAPGTAEALASLARAGWLVACVSNADGTVESLLESVGLREHLAFVVDSGTVQVEKPDPRIFQIALARAGVDAADAYYVGDLFPVDVVGARAAGLVPVLLDPLGRYGSRGCRTARDVPAFCRELVSTTAAA